MTCCMNQDCPVAAKGLSARSFCQGLPLAIYVGAITAGSVHTHTHKTVLSRNVCVCVCVCIIMGHSCWKTSALGHCSGQLGKRAGLACASTSSPHPFHDTNHAVNHSFRVVVVVVACRMIISVAVVAPNGKHGCGTVSARLVVVVVRQPVQVLVLS